MKIKEASLIPFKINFNKPFKYSTTEIFYKEGIILKLTEEDGNVGFGECSPFPFFNKETLIDAKNELTFLTNNLTTDNFINGIKDKIIYPSVAFCVEQAVMSLNFLKNDKTKDSFVNKKLIKKNAVIGLDYIDEVINKITHKIKLGYDTFKIKVGRDNPYDDFVLIEEIRNQFGEGIFLRLDANQKWTCDEAIEYIANLSQFNIEYIEEPCSSICSNLKTLNDININIALDESLSSFDKTKELIIDSPVKFFIIKPMLFGFNDTLEIINTAKTHEKIIIISSLFESAIGKSGLVFLASQVNHNLAHGLDTSEFFENDIEFDVYHTEKPFIEFDIKNYPPDFN